MNDEKERLHEEILRRVRSLRDKQTDSEELLWEILRGRKFHGLKFRRQHAINPYILDFYCHEKRLCIELDGEIHNQKDQKTYDQERNEFLEKEKNITVLRFKNKEIFTDPKEVLEKIYNVSFKSPSPRGEGLGLRGYSLKICGIRTPEMLESCIKNGVDFLGFNFIPSSKRKISLKKFNQLMPPSPSGRGVGGEGIHKLVALFMNQQLEEVLNILEQCPVDIIQLHGDESPEYIQTLTKLKQNRSQERFIKIWKAFRITPDFDIKTLEEYEDIVDAFLFDGSSPGSGQTVDFEILKKAILKAEELQIPYGIAGGINLDNIQDFRKNFPNAMFLDIASGVEEDGEFSEENLLKILNS